MQSPIDPLLESPEVQQELKRSARKDLRKFLILFLIGLSIYLLVNFTPFADFLDLKEVSILDGERTLKLAGVFVLMTVLLMSIGTPRLPFYVLAGFVFGFFEGLGLALIGSLIGSFVMFRAARWGGRSWLLRRFGHKPVLQRILQTQPTITAVAMTRILPISNVFINIGLAMSKVRSRAFLLGSLIGFLPQGIIATLIGSGAADDVAWEGAAQLAIAAAGLMVMLWLFSRWLYRQKQTGE
ncbi:MAG: TVP38/TMEM64 family protein [Methylophaga sp.]|nr:TVP38/TMEM64 family protein [Methylophaga sp.]